MEKEVKIEFNAQSKSVVEKVGITYKFNDSDTFISNEDILKEVQELHNKASNYARDAAFDRQK